MRLWPFGREARLTLWEAFELYVQHSIDMAPRTKRNLRDRLRLWERLGMELRVARITSDTLDEFRRRALQRGYAPYTIETAVNGVYTLIRHCGPESIAPHGRGLIRDVPSRGRRLKIVLAPRPSPSLQDLSAVYRAADVAGYPRGPIPPASWWRVFLVTAYNTALRLGDLLELGCDDLDLPESCIRLYAAKTGKRQDLPVNCVLRDHLQLANGRPGERLLPLGSKSADHLRRELYRICEAAGVERVRPQAIRRRSATEYERTVPGAGGLVLGHTLRSMTFTHYIAVLEVLRKAADRLPQPEAFLEKSSRHEHGGADEERRETDGRSKGRDDGPRRQDDDDPLGGGLGRADP